MKKKITIKCFVDFGFSGRQGEKSKGCTWEYASFERLLSDEAATLAPIDDYEALFVSALYQFNGWDRRALQETRRSRKTHLRSKLEFMGQVADLACCTGKHFHVKWLCQRLMFIWQQPRNEKVTSDLLKILTDPELFEMDIADIARGRLLQKFKRYCDPQEIKEDTSPASGNTERAQGSSMLRDALEKLTGMKPTRYSGTASTAAGQILTAYDSWFLLKNELVANPAVWLNPTAVYQARFPTLTALAGQVVLGETGDGAKSIWHFLNTIDCLGLRPLEYLLLFAGIHVSGGVQQQFVPAVASGSFTVDAQCLELVTRNESSQSRWVQWLSSQLKTDSTFNNDARKPFAVDTERAACAHYPCVGLATLIVAGRFFVESWRGDEPQGFDVIAQSSSDQEVFFSSGLIISSTAQNEQLREEINILRANQEKLQEQIARLLEQNQRTPTVWFLMDGQEYCKPLPSGACVGDLEAVFRCQLRVFNPKSDPSTGQPLPSHWLLPRTSREFPLLVFR